MFCIGLHDFKYGIWPKVGPARKSESFEFQRELVGLIFNRK